MNKSTFKINSNFKLESKNAFVVYGEITSGEISAGMFLVCENKNISIQIDSIEAVYFKENSFTGLLFKSIKHSELDSLTSLPKGETVTIK